jgi:hypothetical protein
MLDAGCKEEKEDPLSLPCIQHPASSIYFRLFRDLSPAEDDERRPCPRR